MHVGGIEVGGAAGVAMLGDLPIEASGAPPMLGLCTAPGCATIVFGRGTCVAHDPPRLHLTTTLFDEATARGAPSNH